MAFHSAIILGLQIWLLLHDSATATTVKQAAKNDIIVTSIAKPVFPTNSSAGSDVAVYSSSGKLKAAIHGGWSTDVGASTVVSSDGNFIFAIGSRNLGPSGALEGYPRGFEGSGIGVTRIAGGSPKFLGTFGADSLVFQGNQLAAGPVLANGSIIIYASEIFGSAVCPERYGSSSGSTVVTLSFNPSTLTLTRLSSRTINEVDATTFDDCFKTNSVVAMRTIKDRLYAVLYEPQGKFKNVLRYLKADGTRSKVLAGYTPKVGEPRVQDAVILGPTSFIVRDGPASSTGSRPNDKLTKVSTKSTLVGTKAPGQPGKTQYIPGLAATSNGDFLTFVGGVSANYTRPQLGKQVYKWRGDNLKGNRLINLNPKFNGLALSVVP